MFGQDFRTIKPNGLLSKAKEPTEPPRTVTMGINLDAKRPPPTHINPDKALEEERAYRQASLNQSSKIICARWHELGYMDDETNKADQEYGRWLVKNKREVMEGYLAFAKHVVPLMHGKTWQSRLFIKVSSIYIRPWSKAMSHKMGVDPKGSKIGDAIMAFGDVFFASINKIRKLKRKYDRSH